MLVRVEDWNIATSAAKYLRVLLPSPSPAGPSTIVASRLEGLRRPLEVVPTRGTRSRLETGDTLLYSLAAATAGEN